MQDIFVIDPGVVYDFYLSSGLKVTGVVVDVCTNGLVLTDGTRIVQDHIVMFIPKE